ncbi:hypothetical protein M9H77_07314 [Catharanthus roseus]|uniref:Uncharacterized protein n=1 Tax=Catharanthus roseus TaxID=4058 RepID=A0ACC0BUU3_CATRO|nr:hypothetical protein M9H77_07314 [Catharanthus roseus]
MVSSSITVTAHSSNLERVKKFVAEQNTTATSTGDFAIVFAIDLVHKCIPEPILSSLVRNLLHEGDRKRELEALRRWELLLGKAAAEINKRNRSMHGPPHRFGRTTFAIIREEMQEKGKETNMLFVYIRTKTNANGVPVSEEATNVINSMKERLKEFPPEEQTVALRNRIFKEFMGLEGHGCVRTWD